MNPVVRLIAAAGLGLAWYIVTRAYSSDSRINKEDPAGIAQRREITGALRSLAFFFIVWFILSTLVIFVFALMIALVAPPNNRGFVDAFGEVVNSATGASGPLSPMSLWGAIALLVATVPAVWISQRTARGQSPLNLGLRPYREMALDIVLGLMLGLLLFAVIFQLENLFGYMESSSGPNYNWGQLAQFFGIFLCVAISEELVVRGYLLQTIDQVWGGATAVITTSIFWGFAHLLNPHANLLDVLNIVVAGLLFAYAYNVTGHLWLPIALHFSWNFAQGAIFGYPISGYPTSDAIFQPFVLGPSEMTGGLFGPEGGLISLFAVVLGSLVLWGWERSRRSPVPPSKKL
jgi:uncharacterized protein